MNEQKVIDMIRSEGVDLIASLPCDRNRSFTSMIHEQFDVVDLTREEDGVGVCAGAFMGGRKPMISIQSSGLGNMMNALMSLTAFYGLPLPIIASWRGIDNETIQAQKMFNTRVPEMLDVFGIDYVVIRNDGDSGSIRTAIRRSFDNGSIVVILVYPSFWEPQSESECAYPPRAREISISLSKQTKEPKMTRLEAIREIMSSISDEDIVVSNIGVPSKEVFASKDRCLNFYMLGSYTQATPLGLGLAISTDRHVYVIDGDGSLLGSSILSVVAGISPDNLTIICLDNGTYGSTGNQITQAYSILDMELLAMANGIKNTVSIDRIEEIRPAVFTKEGPIFIQIRIVPFNSKSPNIAYSPQEIRDRFMGNL